MWWWMIFAVVAAVALMGAYLWVRLSRPAGHQTPVEGDDRRT